VGLGSSVEAFDCFFQTEGQRRPVNGLGVVLLEVMDGRHVKMTGCLHLDQLGSLFRRDVILSFELALLFRLL